MSNFDRWLGEPLEVYAERRLPASSEVTPSPAQRSAPRPVREHAEKIVCEEQSAFWPAALGVLGGAAAGIIGTLLFTKHVFAKGTGVSDFAKSFKYTNLHPSFYSATRDPGTGKFLTVNGHEVLDQFGPVVAWDDTDEGVVKMADVVTGKRAKSLPRAEWNDGRFRDEIAPTIDHELTGKGS